MGKGIIWPLGQMGIPANSANPTRGLPFWDCPPQTFPTHYIVHRPLSFLYPLIPPSPPRTTSSLSSSSASPPRSPRRRPACVGRDLCKATACLCSLSQFILLQAHLFEHFSDPFHLRTPPSPLATMTSMDFSTEPSKTASFMEPMDSTFSYMDSGLDFIQYPQSPAFGVSMALPGTSSSPSIGFNSLNLTNGLEYTYSSPSAYTATAASPARPYTPPDGASISPPSLTYNLSAGELSSDGMASGRRSRGSGTQSPSNANFPSSVPRSHRFNPMASNARAATRPVHRRKNSRANDDSDDEDEDFQPAPIVGANADSRRETIRKQRIESEQRRRDELRDGYARLKDTLPPSNQKASKVSLLDRATNHLRYLETVKDQLENRLKAAETEVHRLRSVNEALMLGTATQRHNTVGATTMVPTASY